ncbi:MAG: acyl-CoA dehydrogenase family protein [Dehalococcoidia bacterium]|nr:acyl-CoA dehydrogenase family protein [Dehalococcoidia bacterium]
MDWNDSEEQVIFRAQVREVIETKLPERYRRSSGAEEGAGSWQSDRISKDPEARKAATDWANALAERGWIAPHWPKEYGGAGLTPMEQFVFKQEMAQAQAPGVGGMGVSLLGPTLIVHGTEAQRAEHLPRILSGEVAWAEGYSEPGAGSDLASLQTRAIKDGDDYVINGQKIWTSGAHTADWLFALVRTDPEAPKHRGISFLMMDIHTPGLNVRPLINMAWEHGFNETFFEDVRVPAKNLVGDENRGWYVGASLLDFERSNIAGAIENRRILTDLIAYATSEDGRGQSRLSQSDSLRHEVAEAYVQTEVLFNFSFRIISMQNRGLIPNYEASTSKLFNSELVQRSARLGTKVFGLYGNLWDRHDPRAPMGAQFTRRYVTSIPSTIAAGSSEIQRNIIATRGLGLPRG